MNKSGKFSTGSGIDRRTFLQVTAAGAVVATALGGGLRPRLAHAAGYDTHTWISPRGTLEVLDDYPYWVAAAMGYFGDLKTKLEPGPSDGTATVKFVDLGQADMGYPSPGVFSFAIANGMDLVSVWHMGAYDVFDFAFRPGEGVKTLKELEGKTVLLGSAAWQSIADPMFARPPGPIRRRSNISRVAGRNGAPCWRAARAMRR